MIYLLLSILSSASVSIVMRLGCYKVRNNLTMLSVSYFTCAIVAGFFACSHGIVPQENGIVQATGLGIITGFLLLAGFLLLQMNIERNGVVLSGIFAKLGVLVPTTISIFFFDEKLELMQFTGIIVAISAIILIHMDKNNSMVSVKLLLIFLLIFSGLSDAMSKIYEEIGMRCWQEVYLLISFLVAFLLSILIVLREKQGITFSDISYGILIGVPNYLSSKFLIKALSDIPAVVVYPTYSVATIGIISIMGIVVFKERLSDKQKIAIFMIGIAIVLLNM